MYKASIFISSIMIALFIAGAIFLACDDSNPTDSDPTYDSLTVVNPNGGELFKVGDKVIVTWGIPKDWPYTQVRIELYGKNGLNPMNDIHDPVNKPQDTIHWIIKSSQKDTLCYICVKDYDGNEQAISGIFNISE